jgi:hypothetical protein
MVKHIKQKNKITIIKLNNIFMHVKAQTVLFTSTYFPSSFVSSTGLKGALEGSWMNTLAFTLLMPTLTFSRRNAIMNNWWVSLESVLTQIILVNLYRVSVVSLCADGTAADSLNVAKSIGCTVGESAAYRLIGSVPGLSL